MIFDTRYGNTEKIAKSLASGLQQSGVKTDCFSTRNMSAEALGEADLICVGAPTEWLTASKPAKEFLGQLKGVNLSGKAGFAFDTKLDRRLSGSAAKFIEKYLEELGLLIISPRESATAFLVDGKIGDAYLKDGEEGRFEQIGRRVAEALLLRSENRS